MTTYKFNTIEANGLADFGSLSTSEKLTNDQAVVKYMESRKVQSEKGFKRPMPKSVTICI